MNAPGPAPDVEPVEPSPGAPRVRKPTGGIGGAWRSLPRPVRVWGPFLVAATLAILYPYYEESLGDWFPSVATATTMTVFVMMALGLNVVVGYAGLLDLGYVAFYAAGAYVVGWFASGHFAQVNIHFGDVDVPLAVPGIHMSPWLIFIAAGIFSAILGAIIGLPTLRLRGDYLAIVTLGFGEIIPQVVRNSDDFFGTGFNLTNGPNGLTPIDPLGFGAFLHGILPFLPESAFTADNPDWMYYWVGLGLVGLTLVCSIMLRDSRLGRAWVAIREDEIAASAMGVPLMRIKTLAYVIGAFIGGVAGGFYAVYKGSTFPADFYLNVSIFILCMVILGGMGNVWGVTLGAMFLSWLNFEGLARIGKEFNETAGTSIDVPKYQFLVFGVIIVATMLFRPQGLIPSQRRQAEFEYAAEEAEMGQFVR